MDANYYPPKEWKDGAYGRVVIGTKGDADYVFVGNTPICLELEKLKVGEFVTIPETHWGRRRTVKFVRAGEVRWNFVAKYDDDPSGKVHTYEDFFEGSKSFAKAVKKANKIRYYNNEIVVTRQKFTWPDVQFAGMDPDTGKIHVAIHDAAYEQLRAYYHAFEELRARDPKSHLTMQTANYWEFRKDLSMMVVYHPNQIMEFKPYIYKKGDARVAPKSVQFI